MTAAICIALFVGCVAMSLRLMKFIKDCDERADEANNWTIDRHVCPGCDGYLEFDDDGSSLCVNCGQTTHQGMSR